MGIFVISLIILINGCTQKQTKVLSCDELVKNFDAKIDSISPTLCNELKENQEIWVGGKLIDISKIYNSAYERNEFTLIFQGFEKQGKIIISSKEENIPYKIGQFYKFDLVRKCTLMYSASSSGIFSDQNLDALQSINC